MPDRCRIEYSCFEVNRVDGQPSNIGCADLNFDGIYDGFPTDGILTFSATSADYENQTYPPGEYEVTIEGLATGSASQLKKYATFVLTLEDPCNPPDSVTTV